MVGCGEKYCCSFNTVFLGLNGSRADIEWWYQFSTEWNGVSMMTTVNKQHPGAHLVSDRCFGGVGGTQETSGSN